MTSMRLSALLLAATLSGAAHADNKLFPTDLLAPQQADVSASLNATEASADAKTAGWQSSSKDYALAPQVGARYGLTNALMLGASVSGISSNTITRYNSGQRDDDRNSGVSEYSLFSRLALVPEGRGPYTVTTDFSLAHVIAHHSDTSFNVYGVRGTVSARTTDLFRTYASLDVAVPSKAYAARSLTATAGGWMLIKPGVTMAVSVRLGRSMAARNYSGYNVSAMNADVIWELNPRTSVKTGLMFGRTTAGSAFDGLVQYAPSHAQRLSVALHHLY